MGQQPEVYADRTQAQGCAHQQDRTHTTIAGDEQLDTTEFEQGLYNHYIMGI